MRAVSLALFRVHIENGFAVASGVGLAAALAGLASGQSAAVAVATGALCVSLSDQPDPLQQKPLILALAVAQACLFTLVASWAGFSPVLFVGATAAAGFWTGFISAYGRRALSLGVTGILAFVFARGAGLETASAIWSHFTLFAGGAFFYAGYALIVARLIDDRMKRLLIAEAMGAFVAYLRAKALLADPASHGPPALRALIDAHAELAERLQAARDTLYAGRRTPLQLRRIDTLIALLDAFETVLSSDADIELLRRTEQPELLSQLGRLTDLIADEVEQLILALRAAAAKPAPNLHESETREIQHAIDRLATDNQAEAHIVAAFRATANKLAYADRHVVNLARTLDPATRPSGIADGLDLEAFRGPESLRYLGGQWSLTQPALRYAIRLAAAMAAGALVTLALPGFTHGNWVLLTIALVMRANYSVTSRRRWDRVTGTLIGCVLAALFIYALPAPLLLAILVLSIGVSHAYSLVRYRITAISASITALLLLHFTAPLIHPQLAERMIDTLVGAGISYLFGFMLPNWERHGLPQTVAELLAADAAFAEAALARDRVRQDYRLARKRAQDAVAALSGAISRIADEPSINRRALAALNQLLAANYLLISDFSSIPVLLRLRGAELDPEASGAAIDAARARVLGLLRNPVKAQPVETHMDRRGLSALKSYEAASVLKRRLAHIERTARRVARIAARI